MATQTPVAYNVVSLSTSSNTVVGGPGASEQDTINSIVLVNKDASNSVTVTAQIDDGGGGGTLVSLGTYVLQPSEKRDIMRDLGAVLLVLEASDDLEMWASSANDIDVHVAAMRWAA